MAERPVTARIHVEAPPDAVYRYFVDPGAMVEWMGDYAELDARPGGRFAVDVRGAPIRGSYLELEPPRRLLIGWGYAGSETLPPGASTVEVRLTPDADGTLVELEHRDLPAQEADGHRSGWRHYAERLRRALAGEAPGPDPGHEASPCPPRS